MSNILTLKLVRVPQGVFVQQIDTRTDIVYFVNTSQVPVMRITQGAEVYLITDHANEPDGKRIGHFTMKGEYPQQYWWYISDNSDEANLNCLTDYLIDAEVYFFKFFHGKVE